MLLLVPGMFLIVSDIKADEWWDKDPYTQWPGVRVYKLLADSPWAVRTPAGFRQRETRTFSNGVPSNYRGYSIQCFYLVRILSARPIREALLRAISLQGTMINVRNILKTEFASFKAAQEQERLDTFIAERPDDWRVKGDDKQIIIGMTLKVGDSVFSHEEDRGAELSNIDVVKVTEDTFLYTDTGRCVSLSFFKLAGPDRLGVKFYFPRIMPDGFPLITADDKELWFTTPMNGMDVRVKFNLKKMIYQGNPEN